MTNLVSYFRRHRRTILLFVSAVFLVLLVLYASLGVILEFTVLFIAEKAGLREVSVSVRSVSFSGIDIDSFQIGNMENSTISVSSIDADYSIWELIAEKRIKSLVLTGAEINCNYDGRQIFFPPLDLSKFKNAQSKDETSSNAFMVSSVEIRDSLLKVDCQGKHFVIPFELKYCPSQNYKAGQGEISLFFREQPVKASFHFDAKTAGFFLGLKDFNLKSLYGLFPEGSEVSGLLSTDITAEIDFAPFVIKSLDASLLLKNAKYASRGSAIAAVLVNLTAKGSGNSFELDSDALSIVQNDKEILKLDAWKLPISLNDKEISGMTDLNVFLPLSGGLNNIPLNMNFSYNFLDGRIKNEMNSTALILHLPKGEALLKGVCLNSELNKSGKSYKGHLSLGIEDVKMPEMEVSLNSIKTVLPFDLSLSSDSQREGSVSIENITYKNFNIGSLNGTIKNRGTSVAFSALAPSVVLPDMAVNLNGRFGKLDNGLFSSEIFFNFPKYKLAIPFDLETWFPKAKGVSFQGEFEADGFMKVSHAGIKSGMNLKIADSTIDMKIKDSSAIASGVSLDLQLNDLLNLQSLPSQSLKVKKVSFGTIALENIYAQFHIESFKAILFESIGAQWCGGIISIQAIRINPSIKNYDFAISCDRVNLAQVLRQFNVGQAEGGGTLNGTIPLVIKDNLLEFGNGFLYSTPGDNGKIHIQGGAIDSITDGVPDGTQQFDQLKLSQMALKDFDYDWVKLYLNSEGDDMVLKLQFDGKPAKPLPFVYKKEIGSFAKVDVNSPGSVFQGIRLDVNIRLPFNKIMWYNKQMQNYLKQL